MKWTIQHSVLILTVVSIILAGVTYKIYTDKQSLQTENQKLEKKLKENNEAAIKVQDNLDRLSERYDSLYKEKNGTAHEKLLQATTSTFKAIYEYDTMQEESSVKNRKASLEDKATREVIESIFPADADKGTPSVTVKSKLKNEPEVYIQSSDKNEITALALVEYTIVIEGSEDQNGSFLYKVKYDQFSDKITLMKNLGVVNLK